LILNGELSGGGFVAKHGQLFHSWAHEGNTRIPAGLGEVSVLGEKPVALCVCVCMCVLVCVVHACMHAFVSTNAKTVQEGKK
jgi:hypothetical protein